MACQTDPPKMCTLGTQLSVKTLQPHYKSTGLFTLRYFIMSLCLRVKVVTASHFLICCDSKDTEYLFYHRHTENCALH